MRAYGHLDDTVLSSDRPISNLPIVRLHSKKIKAEARDTEANFDTERKWIDGIGEIDEDGTFTRSEGLALWLTH